MTRGNVSGGMYEEVEVLRDVSVPMRDGVRLCADIYRPRTDERLPVLILRTPYGKEFAQQEALLPPWWYARHGYVVVVQDVRGRGASEGEFYPFRHEAQDGYDTVEWAAQLPYASGRVGMYGYSYAGLAQLLAAAARPPHLAAIAPGFVSPHLYEHWFYPGGAFALGFALPWALLLASETARRRGRPSTAATLLRALRSRIDDWYWYSPLERLPILRRGQVAPYFFDWLAHREHDPYWTSMEVSSPALSGLAVPSLFVGGWFDVFSRGTLAAFRAYGQAAPPDAPCNRPGGRRLVVGPWKHEPWSRRVGGADHGPAADRSVDELQERWFRRWLHGKAHALPDPAPVEAFCTGINRWNSLPSWPPPGAEPLTLYLRSHGKANSCRGDGVLSRTAPGQEPADGFASDPRRPETTVGGRICCHRLTSAAGPVDQGALEVSNGVLVYTSAPLERDLIAAGPVAVKLYVTLSTPTADLVVKLNDVHPDRGSFNVADGVLRVRTALTEARSSGIQEVRVDLGDVFHCFRRNHRLRLLITGSSFPAYERNPNVSEPPGSVRVDLAARTSQVFVYHTSSFQSELTLRLWAEEPSAALTEVGGK